MMLPDKRVLELYEIKRNGTMEEKRKADKELDEIAKREREEREKNPPPWGDLML